MPNLVEIAKPVPASEALVGCGKQKLVVRDESVDDIVNVRFSTLNLCCLVVMCGSIFFVAC